MASSPYSAQAARANASGANNSSKKYNIYGNSPYSAKGYELAKTDGLNSNVANPFSQTAVTPSQSTPGTSYDTNLGQSYTSTNTSNQNYNINGNSPYSAKGYELAKTDGLNSNVANPFSQTPVTPSQEVPGPSYNTNLEQSNISNPGLTTQYIEQPKSGSKSSPTPQSDFNRTTNAWRVEDGNVYNIAYNSNHDQIGKVLIDNLKVDTATTNKKNDGKTYYSYENDFNGKKVVVGIESDKINNAIKVNYDPNTGNLVRKIDSSTSPDYMMTKDGTFYRTPNTNEDWFTSSTTREHPEDTVTSEVVDGSKEKIYEKYNASFNEKTATTGLEQNKPNLTTKSVLSARSGNEQNLERYLVNVNSANNTQNTSAASSNDNQTPSKYGLMTGSDGKVYSVAYDSNNNIIGTNPIDKFEVDNAKTEQMRNGKTYYKYVNPWTNKTVIGGVGSSKINGAIANNYDAATGTYKWMPVEGEGQPLWTDGEYVYANRENTAPIGYMQSNGKPAMYDDKNYDEQVNPNYEVPNDQNYNGQVSPNYGVPNDQNYNGQGNPYYDGQGNQYPVGQGQQQYEGYGAPMVQPTTSPNGGMESMYVPGVGTLVKEKGEKYYHCNGMLYENPYDNPVGVDKGYYRESSYQDAEGYPANDSGYPSGYWQDVNRNFAPTNYSNNVFTNIDYARHNADIINGMMTSPRRSPVNYTGLGSNIENINRSIKK